MYHSDKIIRVSTKLVAWPALKFEFPLELRYSTGGQIVEIATIELLKDVSIANTQSKILRVRVCSAALLSVSRQNRMDRDMLTKLGKN